MVGSWVVWPITLTQSFWSALVEPGLAQPEPAAPGYSNSQPHWNVWTVTVAPGWAGVGVHVVLGEHGEDEQDHHNDDGDDGVGDLEQGVVLRLPRHLL